MSLISLLIALAAERILMSPGWQFRTYFQKFEQLLKQLNLPLNSRQGLGHQLAIAVIPAVLVYYIIDFINEPLIEFVASTVVLIACFGCSQTRKSYKKYLQAGFRNDQQSCELEQFKLQRDMAEVEESYGQTLVWLNYQYYAVIMLIFVFFGAPGAIFYRILVTISEQEHECCNSEMPANVFDGDDKENANQYLDSQLSDTENQAVTNPKEVAIDKVFHWLDWLPVRLISLGYMFVGHFSRAIPLWLENLLNFNISPRKFLISIAKSAEDAQVEPGDCTSEPCLLVRLAKRNILFMLAVVAVLTISGVVS